MFTSMVDEVGETFAYGNGRQLDDNRTLGDLGFEITLEDNLRKLEALAQQQAYMIQQWWPPTKQVTSELDQEFRDHQIDSLRKERSPTLSPLKKPIFSCQTEIEDSTIGADEDRQIQYVSSVEESSPSNTGEDLSEISTTIDTSENSVCLNPESELGREDREVLSPSTEKTNSEFKEGNSKYSEFDLIDLDGNELSSWMRNCEEWESSALVGYLSFKNLHLHPLDADNNVDTRQIQSMMMKQHLGSTHEVFEKMSKKEIVHVDDSIGLLITLRGGFGLIGSTSSFVFDPWKGLELSSHLKESRRS